jgi:AcrR family transcriptional regulator
MPPQRPDRQKEPPGTLPASAPPNGHSASALPRFAKLPSEKRERILQVAREEFTEHGYAKASLNRIIERSGISKGSMYYYFHDKGALYTAVLEHAFEQLLQELPLPNIRDLGRDEFWPAIERFSVALFDYSVAHPDLMRLVRTVHALEGLSDAPSLEPVHDIGRSWLSEAFLRGQELGLVRTDMPLELMLAIWSAIDTTADRWMLEHWDELSGGQGRQHIVRMLELFRRMWSS